MKKKFVSFFVVCLMASLMCATLSGCAFFDKVRGVDKDKELYKAIAESDELIVVKADGEYQVRVINGEGDDVVTNDYIFSSHWKVEEDFALSSYELSHDGDRFRLGIASFDARVPGTSKIVQPLKGVVEDPAIAAQDGESDESSDTGDAVSSDVSVSQDSSGSESTRRIVCTGYSDESPDGLQIFADEGTYIVEDQSVYAVITSAYDKNIKKFYADVVPRDDDYAGTIVVAVFSKPDQEIIGSDIGNYLEGDATGQGITEDGSVGEVYPLIPESTEQAQISVTDCFDGMIAGQPVWFIVDDMGGTYYILTEDMYNKVVDIVNGGSPVAVEWGVDANGYNVITYVEG